MLQSIADGGRVRRKMPFMERRKEVKRLKPTDWPDTIPVGETVELEGEEAAAVIAAAHRRREEDTIEKLELKFPPKRIL